MLSALKVFAFVARTGSSQNDQGRRLSMAKGVGWVPCFSHPCGPKKGVSYCTAVYFDILRPVKRVFLLYRLVLKAVCPIFNSLVVMRYW